MPKDRTLHILNMDIVHIAETCGLPMPVAGLCGAVVFQPLALADESATECKECLRLWGVYMRDTPKPDRRK